jgi:uncharacterized protein (TIGR02996 family)
MSVDYPPANAIGRLPVEALGPFAGEFAATLVRPFVSEAEAVRAGLMRAILERPDDDAPRLMLADWHDEQAERTGDPWHARRAVTIRRGVAAPLVSWRVAGLEMSGKRLAWPGLSRRGFLEAVTTTTAGFLAGAAAMFSRNPITRVTLTDRHPAGLTNGHHWFWTDGYDFDSSRVPAPLCAAAHDADHPIMATHRSAAVALAVLSRACVAYGRRLAGLPEYSPAPEPAALSVPAHLIGEPANY